MKSSKKIILLILVITCVAAAAIGLTACNNATVQGQLANILAKGHDYEQFVYAVTDTLDGKQVADGTYTVTVQGFPKGSNVFVGDTEYKNVRAGTLVSAELKMDNGAKIFKTACYFNLTELSSYLVPFATYRMQTVDGVEEFKLTGKYSGNTFNYTRSVNGVVKSGSVEGKAPLYDNNEYYQMLRGATTLSSNFTFGFNVPLVTDTEAASAKMTARCSSVTKVKTGWTDSYSRLNKDGVAEQPYKENGIDCYAVNVSRTTEVVGSSHTAYYAKSDITVNGWAVKKPIIKIEEPYKVEKSDGVKVNGKVVYSLLTVSIDKPQA